jgi:hypothetical protein
VRCLPVEHLGGATTGGHVVPPGLAPVYVGAEWDPRRVLRSNLWLVRSACGLLARDSAYTESRSRPHARASRDALGVHGSAPWDSGVCSWLDVARLGVSSPCRSLAGSDAASAKVTEPAGRRCGAVLFLRGRPRDRLCVTIRPRSKIWPPQTPAASSRWTAPARQPRRTGQLAQSSFARSSCHGSAANHRSSSCSWQGSLSRVGWPSAANSNPSGPEPRR